MKISELMKELKKIQENVGDVEVTCTASLLRDDHGGVIPDVFESTAENLRLEANVKFGTHVRIYF
jgi:hypothetical protein